MTTQSVQFTTYDFGASLSPVTLRDPDDDTLVTTADTCAEISADSGVYVAVFDEVAVIPAGVYRLRAVVDGVPLNRFVTLAGVDGELAYSRSERAAELDSAALRTSLGMDAADLDDQLDAILAASGDCGDATLAKQELILTQLDVVQAKTDLITGAGAITRLLAGAVLEPGTITGFPETITIGDSYTELNGRSIQIPIVDVNGTPISSTGSLNFSDADVTFEIKRIGETDTTRIITGTASFVDPPGTGTSDAETPYALIQLPSSETGKGLIGYKYSGVLTFTWTGTGSNEEVMSFETETIQFDN
jgi:hypothetical protein